MSKFDVARIAVGRRNVVRQDLHRLQLRDDMQKHERDASERNSNSSNDDEEEKEEEVDELDDLDDSDDEVWEE